jgi:hypothetical protein
MPQVPKRQHEHVLRLAPGRQGSVHLNAIPGEIQVRLLAARPGPVLRIQATALTGAYEVHRASRGPAGLVRLWGGKEDRFTTELNGQDGERLAWTSEGRGAYEVLLDEYAWDGVVATLRFRESMPMR